VKSETDLDDRVKSETDLDDRVKSETDLDDRVKSKTDLDDRLKSETDLDDWVKSKTDLDDGVKSEDGAWILAVRRQRHSAVRRNAEVLTRRHVTETYLLLPPDHVTCTTNVIQGHPF